MELAECLKQLIREVVAEELERALASRGNGKQKILFDTKETAELLKLPASWVAAAARRGEIPSVRLGHHVRFRLQDIEQLCIQNSGTALPAKAKRQSRKSSVGDAAAGTAGPIADDAAKSIITPNA